MRTEIFQFEEYAVLQGAYNILLPKRVLFPTERVSKIRSERLMRNLDRSSTREIL